MATEAKMETSVNQIGDTPTTIKIHKGVKVLTDIKTVLVEFVDKEGVKQTKLAFIFGDEVRFLKEDSLSGPVQDWVANNIFAALRK